MARPGANFGTWKRDETADLIDRPSGPDHHTFAGELVYHITHPGGRTELLVHQYRFCYLCRFEAEHVLARADFLMDHVYSDLRP